MTRLINQGYSVDRVSDFFNISRQAYYKRIMRNEFKINIYNKAEKVVQENRIIKSRSGLRSIYYKEGITDIGINQFEKEMSARGYALKPKRSLIKTTDSRGNQYKFDNLISGKKLNGENQVIVGDITYYQIESGLYYIFHFVDYYTMEVKGLTGSRNMEGVNAEKCLRQTLSYNNKKIYDNKLILHTDGGSQYRSHNFQRMLIKAQILPSQAENCLENGLSERANGIIKNDYLTDYKINSLKHLNYVLKKIQKQINEDWPSKILGYKTPKKYAEMVRSLKYKDRPIKLIKKFSK